MATDLVSLISSAIALHDPLWLVRSNYDEHYWDDVATEAAPLVAVAEAEHEVRVALSSVLSVLIDLSDRNPYARDRVAAASVAIWQHLRP